MACQIPRYRALAVGKLLDRLQFVERRDTGEAVPDFSEPLLVVATEL